MLNLATSVLDEFSVLKISMHPWSPLHLISAVGNKEDLARIVFQELFIMTVLNLVTFFPEIWSGLFPHEDVKMILVMQGRKKLID